MGRMVEQSANATETRKQKINRLLHGTGRESLVTNHILLVLNIAAVFLFALEPLFPTDTQMHLLEMFFGIIFAVEYSLRLWVEEKKLRWVFTLMSLIDLIVILSLFAPLLFGNFAFLRVIRGLRILRTYRVILNLKKEKSWFARNEDLVTAVINLLVFIFIMTDIVFVVEGAKNDTVNTYLDALYFTLATLTTTGFGDITLHGTSGKLLSIVIMVFGITLFVKLGREIFRPGKAQVECRHCGLDRHDWDSSHCKHCGNIIRISTHGNE